MSTVDELSAQVATLVDTVAGLTTAIGDIKNKADLAVRPAELPNGEYPLEFRIHQIGVAIDDCVKQVKAFSIRLGAVEASIGSVPATTTTTTVVAPTGPTIPPLSSADIQAVDVAMTNGVTAGIVVPDMRDRIASELSQGIYTFFDQPLIDSVKVWFYNGASSSDRTALAKYLAIIDQRDPTTNAQLQPGSPLLKQVSGAPVQSGTSVSVPSDLRSALAAMGFEFCSTGQVKSIKFLADGPDGEGQIPGYAGVDDGALRMFSNISGMVGQPWSAGQVTNPNLPVTMHAYEREGGISWDLGGSTSRKTLVWYLAGFIKSIGPRTRANIGKFIDLCSFETGRGWRFNTFPAGGNAMGDISTALQLDADNPNAVCIRVGGLLRRIVLGADGNLTVGEVVDESQ